MVFAENTIFFHFFSINDVVLYEIKDFRKIKYRMKYLINVFKRIDGKRLKISGRPNRNCNFCYR